MLKLNTLITLRNNILMKLKIIITLIKIIVTAIIRKQNLAMT